MAQRPRRPCGKIGCPELVEGGTKYCDKHIKDARSYDKQRGTAAERGYGARWQKARLEYLQQHPLCVTCLSGGDICPATVVDHKKPHKGDKVLFWDVSNWQSLCLTHHSIKSAKEDGGFGTWKKN